MDTITTFKRTCDNCGRDLTYSNNSVDYCLELKAINIPSRGGIVTDMNITPEMLGIDGIKNFCHLRCLKDWA